ncbi:MAG: ABC transporter substrate-binding protein, partial [Pyrinomonadaceae bacterium]
LLRELAPDLILTQNLCQVCAPSGTEVSQALSLLPKTPQILWLTPNSIDQIFDNVRELGEATSRGKEAEQLIGDGRRRLEAIAEVTQNLSRRPRVFCAEWLDPIYCSGHWVPEMVRIAGGVDALAQEGADSVRIGWDDVLEWEPEILIVTPCGLNLDQTIEQSQQLFSYPGWAGIPAVVNGCVYAVDANSYFARPGPRVVDGTELLAHLFHPRLLPWNGATKAFQQLTQSTS